MEKCNPEGPLQTGQWVGLWRRQKWQLKIGLFGSFSPFWQPVQKCMMLTLLIIIRTLITHQYPQSIDPHDTNTNIAI
jgi:hypothetical protein